MIKVSHLYKSFNDQPILKDVNFEVKEGEILAILGQSGVGKSVLLKHLIGLLVLDKGSIEIDSMDVTSFGEKDWLLLRKKMGYLFQDGALYDFMTIFENVAFPLKEHTKMNEQEIREKVRSTLNLVGLDDIEEKYPSELSGGMQKRAALARAVILNSKILLCDEPTSGLDPIRSRDIADAILNISRHFNTTTVITSHDMKNSFRIADRLVIMKDGSLVAQGTAREIESIDNAFVKEFLN
ncbi:MAG: ATP-binding cassette domain-containing protein [Candidatus Omnitrophica bacterium]|nr:ATP-binding cassette domain-containing protein [Candidatus Omnitrophota bacterium]